MNAETALQKAVTDLLAIYERQGKLAWFPVPNGMHIAGGSVSERQRKVAVLKRLGLIRAGAPDIVLVLPGGQFAAIELKSEKGHMSEAQHDMAKAINARDGWFAVARSVDEVDARLKVWIRTAEMRAERRAAA